MKREKVPLKAQMMEEKMETRRLKWMCIIVHFQNAPIALNFPAFSDTDLSHIEPPIHSKSVFVFLVPSDRSV